ncbi:MAG: hypothetical protein PHS66_04820 [Candidatus Omnitrophica bacterium]|nr:hypothetical protein [Candidatus Omnitrophota bacterium]
MAKFIFAAAALLACSFISFNIISADEDGNAASIQTDKDLPEGMELRNVTNTPGYKVVLPKGTNISRQGDLRVIEGAGEYAARRLAEFEEQLTKMNSDIESLRKEIDQIKEALAQIQKPQTAGNVLTN